MIERVRKIGKMRRFGQNLVGQPAQLSNQLPNDIIQHSAENVKGIKEKQLTLNNPEVTARLLLERRNKADYSAPVMPVAEKMTKDSKTDYIM